MARQPQNAAESRDLLAHQAEQDAVNANAMADNVKYGGFSSDREPVVESYVRHIAQGYEKRVKTANRFKLQSAHSSPAPKGTVPNQREYRETQGDL